MVRDKEKIIVSRCPSDFGFEFRLGALAADDRLAVLEEALALEVGVALVAQEAPNVPVTTLVGDEFGATDIWIGLHGESHAIIIKTSTINNNINNLLVPKIGFVHFSHLLAKRSP